MQYDIPFTQFVQSTPLFTLCELRQRYRKKPHSRSILNMLHRLRQQGRVRQLTKGVYRGALAAVSLNRFRVPAALRNDAAVALHSALEWHGVANQVFQTVYYFSARARAQGRRLRQRDLPPGRPPRRSRTRAQGALPNTENFRGLSRHEPRTIPRRLFAVSRLQRRSRRTRSIT